MTAMPDPSERPDRRFPGRVRTTLEWIPVELCFVKQDSHGSPKGQRHLDMVRVSAMAEGLDPDALGLPFVVEVLDRGKVRYVIIDGQHRIKAVEKALGADQKMLMEVVRNVTPQRAAALFRLRNNSKKVQRVDTFRAAVEEGDVEAVQIAKIVQSVGLRIDRARGDGAIQAVRALQLVYRGDRAVSAGPHPIPLKRTLLVCKEAWGTHTDAFNGDILLGLGFVMIRHGDTVEIVKMISKLASLGTFKVGPRRLLGNARAIHAASGGNMPHAVAEVICNLYGHGKGGLPRWRPDAD